MLAWGLARAMRDIEETLELARIPFDSWFSEAELHRRGEVEEAIGRLEERGYLYEAEGALWFRSTDFGDEKDRVLVTGDGRYTYLAPDVAYHLDKFDRGFDRLINIWGADHHGYVPRMKAAVAALGFDPDRLELIITQMVNLFRNGEPVRMSTRAGEFVTFRKVIEEVGADAARYYLVAVSPDTTLNFDLEEAKRQSMENPVYYLQYAYARVRSLEEFAAGRGVRRGPLEEADLSRLDHPAEVELLKQADRLGEEVAEAAARRAPHRIAAYGQDFASAFHKFYTDCRIVTDDAALTQARLWLVGGGQERAGRGPRPARPVGPRPHVGGAPMAAGSRPTVGRHPALRRIYSRPAEPSSPGRPPAIPSGAVEADRPAVESAAPGRRPRAPPLLGRRRLRPVGMAGPGRGRPRSTCSWWCSPSAAGRRWAGTSRCTASGPATSPTASLPGTTGTRTGPRAFPGCCTSSGGWGASRPCSAWPWPPSAWAWSWSPGCWPGTSSVPGPG